jgi:copper transport protein
VKLTSALPTVGVRRILLLGLLVGLIGLFTAPAVLAHSVLVRSDPAANAKLPQSPKVVSIYFSEPLEAKFSSAKVVDSSGAGHDEHDSRVDAADGTHLTLDVKPLQPGFYSVLWTTVSKVDGHKLQGSYPFIVLNPDGSLPAGSPAPTATGTNAATSSNGAPDVIAYWLSIVGAVALFGAAVFVLAVAFPSTLGLAGGETIRRRIMILEQRLIGYALGAFFAGQLGELVLQLRVIGGLPALSEFLTTSFGEFWLARVALGLIATGCLLALGLSKETSTRAPLLSLLALAGIGLLVCFSLTSHAGAVGNGSFWATLGDFLHLITVGLWIGGLISLAVLLVYASRGQEASERLHFRAGLAARFSPIAAASVTVILLTGLFNGVVEIPTLGALIHTAYGRSLIAKLIVVAVLLAIAAVNAFYLRPALLRTEEETGAASHSTTAQIEQRLRQTVIAEAATGILVLLIVGLLLIFVPSRDLAVQAAQSSTPAAGSSVFNNTVTSGDLTIQLTVDPNKVGLNTYRVKLTDAQGPVNDASLVRLDLTFADPKFGGSNIALPKTGDGVYEATGANFAQVGRWQVTTVVRRPGRDDALTSFTVEVPDASGNLTINRVSQTDPFASPSHLFTTDQLGGMALVLLGLLPLVLRRQLWELGPVPGAATTFFGVAGLILGGTLFFAAHQEGTVDYTLLANPVPVSNDSVGAGKALYMQNCAVCHGDTGHGDGPAAKGLNPQPVDLTVHVGLHADGVLWGWITNGIPRTAMPAWKDKLSDTERWEIVDFLRTDFQTSALLGPSQQPDNAEMARAWAVALDSGDRRANP